MLNVSYRLFLLISGEKSPNQGSFFFALKTVPLMERLLISKEGLHYDIIYNLIHHIGGISNIVSVADMYDLCGMTCNYTDNKYGWKSLARADNATVQRKQKAAEEAGVKLKPKDVKKASQQALTKAREEVGSVSRRDRNIVITDKEWDAIQAGAVSESILKRVLNNCDPDSLRQRAMPKETKVLNQAKINRIKAMSASYTIQQIAEKLGVSTSTVSKYLKGAN